MSYSAFLFDFAFSETELASKNQSILNAALKQS